MKLKRIVMLFACMMYLGVQAPIIQAYEVSGEEMVTDDSFYIDIDSCIPTFYYYELNAPHFDKNGTVQIEWYIDRYKSERIKYEFEISTSSNFKNAKKYTTEDTQITLKKSVFGKNGGKFYFRARSYITSEAGETQYSGWSETEEFIFVAINKKNFPGLYTLLKNGSEYRNYDLDTNKSKIVKITFDSNKDGWLDPKEICSINRLDTIWYSKEKNGSYYRYPSLKISDLTGIEYLPYVYFISFAQFSGKKIDLSKNKVGSLYIQEITANEITVNAPNTKSITIEAAYNAKLSKMNFSSCTSAVELTAYGSNKTKTLILPKANKNLKILSLSNIGANTLSVNNFKKLQQLYLYTCDYTKIKMNQCTDMRYLYLYYCGKIKSLDITANKKLRGVDFYESKGLMKSTVKAPKKTKVTWKKGKWWYGTEAYKSDISKIFNSTVK